MQNARRMLITMVFGVFLVVSAAAQTTTFSYQGSLNDGANAANGNYDFEFALFDALAGGAQIGTTLSRGNVAVANGIFSVSLDFGSQFPGADRFLEIRVRATGGGAFTPLSPRQPVNSSPYSIRSLNADQLGGLAASGFVQNTTSQQATSNFNISGTGTANVFNAATQYNIGGIRMLSNPGLGNLFAGRLAGSDNTTGNGNSFVGEAAGTNNTEGSDNSFFGRNAGFTNTTGIQNSFFGGGAGSGNMDGSFNTFVGMSAGFANTGGSYNSFFGRNAGANNMTGNFNSFVGADVGQSNTTGAKNSFFGSFAGRDNTEGESNSFFGSFAGQANTTGERNSFFGLNAGFFNSTGDFNSFYGGLAGRSNMTGESNSFFGHDAGDSNTTGDNNTVLGANADVGSGNLTYATAIGANAIGFESNTIVLGRSA
ncbi:MAG: hypothetical protein WBO10_01060, partial [Pyrinomonadaceae bacterium]